MECIRPTLPFLFSIAALDGFEWSVSRAGRFTPGTHRMGDWMDPRTSAWEKEKISSLYRESNQDSLIYTVA